MKIAQVIRHYNKVSGAARVVAELCENLTGMGHEVHVYTHSWPKDTPRNIKFHYVPIFKLNFPFEISSFTYFSTALLKNSDYDVVNNHGDCRYKGVFTCHGCQTYFVDKILKKKPSSLDRYIMDVETFIYKKRNYKKIIAVSNLIKNQIIECFGVPEDDIAVVYNGVNLEEFGRDKTSSMGKIRDLYRIGTDNIVLLFVARDFKRKGLDVVLDALSLLRNAAFKLLVVGKDVNMRYFINKAGKLDLNRKVIFTGPQKNVSEYYAASDIYIFPSASEPCALAELEAMGSGLAMIISPPEVNGFAEIIEDGKDGLILENHENPAELAEKLGRLLENKDLRIRMGACAAQKAVDYTWQKVAARTLDVYRSVI